jgi:hypothetical protein
MSHTTISRRTRFALSALAVSGAAALAVPATASATDGERTVTIGSVVEDQAADTATFTMHRGVDADGEQFWYVVTESSNKQDAARRQVNRSRKLANARNTDAVQRGWFDRQGVLHVEDTVDFSPARVVVPGPGGFPPNAVAPGSVGQANYSPLVQLPNGTILNAPHVANASGQHDKLVAPIAGRSATFQESEGFYEGKEVYYVSFDASDPGIAALEGVTFAPNLNAAPGVGDGGSSSARSGIGVFLNGQTGASNPNRQGLASALLGEGDPLNLVDSLPDQSKYSPLWDVHMAVWTDGALAAGQNTLQTDFDDLEDLAEDGALSGPSGTFEANGAIVNCPIISVED